MSTLRSEKGLVAECVSVALWEIGTFRSYTDLGLSSTLAENIQLEVDSYLQASF